MYVVGKPNPYKNYYKKNNKITDISNIVLNLLEHGKDHKMVILI